MVLEVTLNVNPTSIVVGEQIRVSGKVEDHLTGDNKVSLHINGDPNPVKHIPLNEKGDYEAFVTIHDPGDFILQTRWEGPLSDEWSNEVNVNVQSEPQAPVEIILELNQAHLKSGNNIPVSILLRYEGSPLMGHSVDVDVGTYGMHHGTTDNTGRYGFEVGPLQAGTLKITVDVPTQSGVPGKTKNYSYGVDLTNIETSLTLEMFKDEEGRVLEGRLNAPKPGGLNVVILANGVEEVEVVTGQNGTFSYPINGADEIVSYQAEYEGGKVGEVNYLPSASNVVNMAPEEKKKKASAVAPVVAVGGAALAAIMFWS